MSAYGYKRTLRLPISMSALPPTADIGDCDLALPIREQIRPLRGTSEAVNWQSESKGSHWITNQIELYLKPGVSQWFQPSSTTCFADLIYWLRDFEAR